MLVYEIVTPEKVFNHGQAKMIVVPGTEGCIGFLKDHAPMVSTLGSGLVLIYSDDTKIESRFFVPGGFVNMAENKCSILVDEAIPFSELTIDYIDVRLSRAEKAVAEACFSYDKGQAIKELEVCKAMKNCTS